MKPIIISFEGLGGSLGRWVRRGLLKRLPEYEHIERVWSDLPVLYGQDCIIVAHSFGVRAAVKSAALNGAQCKLLLLLDPRMPPWGTGGVVAPEGVRTVCLWRRGFMRGYEVEGAENFELSGIGHLDVPFTDLALEMALEGLR